MFSKCGINMEDSLVVRQISLAVGYDNFDELLQGANENTYFKTEEFDVKNMPVISLLSIWYNFFVK
jgi:glucose-6-phosphate isomerase